MWFAIKSVISVIVSLLLGVFPNSAFLQGFDALQLATKEDDCLLNAAIVSDIHIDVEWPIGEWIWDMCFNDLERSVDTVDAIIVSGDLTNYGDGPSIESYFNIMAENDSVKNWVVAMGNHDVGHVEYTTQEGARQRFVDLYNELNPRR